MRSPLRRGWAILATVAVAALVLIATVVFRWGSAGSERPAAARPTPSPTPSGDLTVAEVYETVAPSVVSIRSAKGPSGATGTGVIANANGAILTALHVVADARAIEVIFADGTRAAATIAASDPKNDIAALTPAALPQVVVPAVLGGGASVGDQVTAIGDPLGLIRTTTSGVVSGVDRTRDAPNGAGNIQGLIQFDAAVNPGSSGGPLINARGETIGIVVSLANPTDAGTFIGIGFAVPIGTALAGGTGPGDGPPPQL
jgi:S1-C subfamily serine protease